MGTAPKLVQFHNQLWYVSSMRGADEQQAQMFSYINLEDRIPRDHPLRPIRTIVDRCLKQMQAHFNTLYAEAGRPSIPPERLMRALVLQVVYGVRSERRLMQDLDLHLLYRWFVGLSPDDAVWDVTVFTKNRDRLVAGEVAQHFFDAVLDEAKQHDLLSDEHFTVDGTLIQAWASRKSFVPKDPPPAKGTGSGGKKLLRDTHQSKTDADARLYKKSTGAEARPSYLGHVLIENRHGLVVAARATQASTTAEREAALAMLDQRGRRPDQVGDAAPITIGGDKLYQEEKFIDGLRARKVIPHVAEYAPNEDWPNWQSDAERQHPGFAISQRKRKLVEKIFGWGKLDSILRQVKVRGVRKVDWFFRLLASGANLVRLAKLIPAV